MANPPIARNTINAAQLQAKAHPAEESRYKAPNALKQRRRPYRSLGVPAPNEPRTVPHNALETVIPSVAGESANVSLSALVAPEMTAVSKPKRSPPKPATRELRSKYPLSEIAIALPATVVLVLTTQRPLLQSNPG